MGKKKKLIYSLYIDYIWKGNKFNVDIWFKNSWYIVYNFILKLI